MRQIFALLIMFFCLNSVFSQDYKVNARERYYQLDMDLKTPFLEFRLEGEEVRKARNIGLDITTMKVNEQGMNQVLIERIWIPFNDENFTETEYNSFLLKKTDFKFSADRDTELKIVYPDEKLMYLCETEAEIEFALPKVLGKLAALRRAGVEVEVFSGDRMIVRKDGRYHVAYAILYCSEPVKVHIRGKQAVKVESGSVYSAGEKSPQPEGALRMLSKEEEEERRRQRKEAKAFWKRQTVIKDSDGDGVRDDFDRFPNDPRESVDTDHDGIGDNADPDDDNDGVPDDSDEFPLDPSEQYDNDADGLADNADPDDDNDGVPDVSDPDPIDPNIPYRYEPQKKNVDAWTADDTEKNPELDTNFGLGK